MQELTKNKRGIQSDNHLLETINHNPGLSQYELGQKLNWQTGKIDGAIRRLVNENKILIRATQRNGRQVNLVYPKEDKPANQIEIPITLLHVGSKVWSTQAFVYALDSTTIGITGEEFPEWKETACFSETTPLKKDKEKFVLQIPQRFNRFYNFERRHKVVSVNGNAVLITITGTLIEQKKYPS